jgi:formate dehydrogenase major subunit
VLSENYADTEDLDGLFSGFDPGTRHYDISSWRYTGERDETLQHPRCVYQVLKRHYARYTPEMVERVCGVPQDRFRQVCETWASASGRERTSMLVYSVGWTHHSVGVQYIRAGSVLQLLLGNVGRPGGGVMALRGHASIQGSTDIPTLFNLLPGYLPMPSAAEHPTLQDWVDTIRKPGQKGFWGAGRSYAVSLLKAYWGEAASADNDYCYGHLPRMTGDHGTYRTVLDMIDGKVKGYFLLGQNPAVGSANGKAQRLGMANLDWLVVRDLFMIESATFWKDGPEVATGEIVPEQCRTEVFFLPAASHVEKEGTFTQTQRLLQWREKAVDPVGDCRSELWFFFHLGLRVRDRLAASTERRDRAVLDLAWDYPTHGEHDEPSAEAVLAEINGYRTEDRTPLSSYTQLADDGSTAAGCWIYTGVYADGVNQAARRTSRHEQDEVAGEWGWAWPANRRILYNRASADPAGKPWSERKKYVWWDGSAGEWTGLDVPDFEAGKPPSYVPPDGAAGIDAIAGDDPFIMQGDGKGWLFAPHGLLDGPVPSHYEPVESPVRNPLYGQQANPTRTVYERPDNVTNPSPPEEHTDVFPVVFTTSRLTEHHTAGGMSRNLEYLAELMPAMFIEVSPELAAERGLTHLGWAHVVTARSAVEGRVLVTDRLAPLRIDGRVLHQVWLPFHWGQSGLSAGDSANDLVGINLDPNVLIQESKVGTCDVVPGRRPTGAALLAYVEDYRRRADVGGGRALPIVTASNPAEED